MIRWLSIDEWTNLSHLLQTARWNFLQTHFTEVFIVLCKLSPLCVLQEDKTDPSDLWLLPYVVWDCKKKYNLLSTEIVLAILSQHLFQVGGKGSENVHETTSYVLFCLSQNPLLLTLKYNSEFFTYSPESTATVNFINRPQYVVDVWVWLCSCAGAITCSQQFF